jgi:hypothetical protein
VVDVRFTFSLGKLDDFLSVLSLVTSAPAMIQLGLGDDGEAIESFDKALAEHDMDIVYLGSNFYFDSNRQPLKENPKYKPLLRKIGLPK